MHCTSDPSTTSITAPASYPKPSWTLIANTTCTRFRRLLAASLLTITADRHSCILPPTAGAKFIHHTSPRFIACIPHQGLCPFQALPLARLVAGHLGLRRVEVGMQYMRPDQILDEPADAPRTNDLVM